VLANISKSISLPRLKQENESCVQLFAAQLFDSIDLSLERFSAHLESDSEDVASVSAHCQVNVPVIWAESESAHHGLG